MAVDMLLLPRLAQRLMRAEGFSLVVYDDATGKEVRAPVGALTIGYGHNLQSRGLPEPIAQMLLLLDLLDSYKDARVLYDSVWAALGMARQEVLVEFVFWLGRAGAKSFVKMRAALEAGDFVAAAQEMVESKAAREYPERMARLSVQMDTGVPVEVV